MFWFDEESNKKKEKVLTKEEELESLVWKFFMEKLPRLGFEQREGQEDMALDICESIKEKKPAVIEAGVGIGKSYAYIVPLLYYNKIFNKPVIIATSTIALQEQLIEDIKRVCSYVNYRPEVVLAKGMTHFACKRRVDLNLKPKVRKGLYSDAETLYRYIYGGKIDRRYINMELDEDMWNEVNVEMTDHTKCRHYKSCRFMELRNDMFNTEGIILCNQDLLTVHLQKLRKGQRGLLNPKAELIIVDEAHNLEEKVRSSLIENFNKDKIKRLLNESKECLNNYDEKMDVSNKLKKLALVITPMFKELRSQINNQKEFNKEAEEFQKFFIDIDKIRPYAIEVEEIVDYIYKVFLRSGDNSIPEELMGEVENIRDFFKELSNSESRNIFWTEEGRNIDIFACPKNMAKEIRMLYFDKSKTTILTSATIADKKSEDEEEAYEYFIKNTGFPTERGFLAVPKESPFPYNENSILYYHEGLPHPINNREEYIEKSIDVIENLINITEGRTLILFSAKSDLVKVYDRLKERKLPYKILKQGSSSSQDQLLHRFREDEKSVLLATGIFWEGIDVPGKSLSNVIIFKLPFPVPDPIINYKRNHTEDFLMEVSVPLMIVKLRQGVGRLIRKQDDRGIVAILDPRVSDGSTSRYKKVVFDSLPVKRRTNDIKAVKAFWDKK